MTFSEYLRKLTNVAGGMADSRSYSYSVRPESKPQPKTITIYELIARGTSHVRIGEKIYRIVCEEVKPK